MTSRRFSFSSLVTAFVVIILLGVLPVFANSFSGVDVRVTGSGTQFEMTAAVNPANPNNILGGYQELLGPTPKRLAHAASLDGGQTWTSALFPTSSTYEFYADPQVAFDRFGKAFFVGLALRLCRGDFLNCQSDLTISTSVDGGVSWTTPSVFQAGQVDPGFMTIWHDKPALAVDTVSPGDLRGRIYVSWTEIIVRPITGGSSSTYAIYFTYSTDGGASFSPPLALSPEGKVQFSAVAVGLDGTVYVTWADGDHHDYRLKRSMNGGASFEGPYIVQSYTGPLGARSSTQSLASDRLYSNMVYVAYTDSTGTGGTEVRFTRSTDRGQTWSPFITLNEVSAGNQFYPAMSTAVGPVTGRIDIIWYDGRIDPKGTLVDVYYGKSLDQGQSFEPNLKINDVSIDSSERQFDFGDYISIASSNSYAHAVWTGVVDPQDPRDMVTDRISFPGSSGGGGGGTPRPI